MSAKRPTVGQAALPALGSDGAHVVRVLQLLRLIDTEPKRWTRNTLAAHFGVAEHAITRDLRLIRLSGYQLRRHRRGYAVDDPGRYRGWLYVGDDQNWAGDVLTAEELEAMAITPDELEAMALTPEELEAAAIHFDDLRATDIT